MNRHAMLHVAARITVAALLLACGMVHADPALVSDGRKIWDFEGTIPGTAANALALGGTNASEWSTDIERTNAIAGLSNAAAIKNATVNSMSGGM